MGIQAVVMPKWGLSMTTGTVTEWLVEEGDEISKGQDLVEIDTDKIVGTLEADFSGVLRRIVTGPGEQAPVGGTIAVVAGSDVSDGDIDAAVEKARADNASGAVEEASGPEIATVTVDGRALSYAKLGDGDDVLVLVHGYGGDKNSWLFVQEPLSSRFTTYALDLPGHGASAKDVGDGSLDLLSSALLGFLAAMDISSAHLVGHSLGGAVAVRAAASPVVSGLTLVAPAGIGPDINADYLRGFASASTRRELKPHLAALFADEKLVNRQLADDLLKYKRLDGVSAALDALLRTLSDGIDVSGELAALTKPVSVVWGVEDRVVPIGNAAALPESVTLRRIDGAGHMVHMENPAAVRDAIP
ncbi:acetoin dehydrogenase dihydrolipoyllysine-residue acetyltransferase subunit [Fodinicola acaciae]|uniref:acetoin dehydrogenase dihydrolipoyllysine-residue acetyltransferase subunit n=1 Tax=Fodinicola acaciae TaxID=2681555 RepID=UPI0013D3B7D5|nr:acetoin dehydrogenase dihydrolipoyllysine-residue acetyltransferase subunit [Fodinicola acaciae]